MTPSSHSDAVRAVFDRWAADGRGEGMERGHRDVVLQMLDRAQIRSHHQVLDLGCGAGWTVRLIAELVPGGRAFGVDSAEEMIRRARGAPNPANAAFSLAPVEELPYADDSLHRVLSMESIYYWRDIPAALREARRVLAPGGRFLAAMEYYAENPWSAAWAAALGLELRRYSGPEYVQMLLDAGFVEAAHERLVDRRAPAAEEDFEPSEYFPDYGTYRKYLEAGALLVTARKAGEEPGPAAGSAG